MITERIAQWLLPKKRNPSDTMPIERCALSISDNAIRISALDATKTKASVKITNLTYYTNKSELQSRLNKLSQLYQLDQIPCSLMLTPGEYQVFLIETLPVEKSELLDALKWRIRSLISYPIEETLIDSFPLPDKSVGKNKQIMAVVVANKDTIKQKMNILKSANVNIKIIDIPELAMRNLSAPYEADDKSTAMIYIFKTTAVVNITRNKTLYFTKHINLLESEEINQQTIEQLALDIIRSLDYYQSQWRFPTPTRIFIEGSHQKFSLIKEPLSKALLTTVQDYILPENIELKMPKDSASPNNCLLEIGCALREVI